jgi:hypothetical protein
MQYRIGDIVIIENKHLGPWQGCVYATDPDGSIIVRHSLKKYPMHPSGATYVNVKNLESDVTLVKR